MTGQLNKASRYAKSALLLLQDGDTESAVNRSYYSMFSAARVALQSVDPALIRTKTHSELIRRFGKHVVVGFGLDASLGRAINRAEHLRKLADYDSAEIDMVEAQELVDSARLFLTAIEKFLKNRTP